MPLLLNNHFFSPIFKPLKVALVIAVSPIYLACNGDDSASIDTESSVEIAVNGSGYLILSYESGDEWVYARSASLSLNSRGTLVNEQGLALKSFSIDSLGQVSGIPSSIELPVTDLESITIDEMGSISSSDGEVDSDPYAQVAMAEFPSGSQLEPLDDALFAESDASGQPRIAVAATGSLGEIIFASDLATPLDYTLELGVSEHYFYLGGDSSAQYSASVELFLDKNGYLVDQFSNRLMTYPEASADGMAIVGEEQINYELLAPEIVETSNLDPKRSTKVTLGFNLVNYDYPVTEFDALDRGSYNSVRTLTIYDSLGISHTLSVYFVKRASEELSANHWQIIVQIDDEDVGDPDTSLASPNNTVATQAVYDIYFDEGGSLNTELSDRILISNWVPLDENGLPNSSAGPQNFLAGGSFDIDHDRPVSSNFIIDYAGSTSPDPVAIYLDQNGYLNARVRHIAVENCGKIIVSFTNDLDTVIGQLALVSFSDPDGLSQNANGLYEQSETSGSAIFGAPCVNDFNAISGDDMDP